MEQEKLNGATPEQVQQALADLSQRLLTNTQVPNPECSCLGPGWVYNEGNEGPFYTHLGAGRDIPTIRKIFEARTGFSGNALRIEKVSYTGKEGKSSLGCPIAKWIIRRQDETEKILVIVRQRPGHHCASAVVVCSVVVWEGVPSYASDMLYDRIRHIICEMGVPTLRRCASND